MPVPPMIAADSFERLFESRYALPATLSFCLLHLLVLFLARSPSDPLPHALSVIEPKPYEYNNRLCVWTINIYTCISKYHIYIYTYNMYNIDIGT